MGTLTQDNLIIIAIILIFLIIIFFIIKYSSSSTTVDNDSTFATDDDDDDDAAELLFDELAFLFPELNKFSDPLTFIKFLFENKEITEASLQEPFNNISNFKQENNQISFDIEGMHIDFNPAESELTINDSVHVANNTSGLLFSEGDKSLAVALHEEDDGYVVDHYTTVNPEGISHNAEEMIELVEAENTEEMIKLVEAESTEEVIELVKAESTEENVENTTNDAQEEKAIDNDVLESDTRY